MSRVVPFTRTIWLVPDEVVPRFLYVDLGAAAELNFGVVVDPFHLRNKQHLYGDVAGFTTAGKSVASTQRSISPSSEAGAVTHAVFGGRQGPRRPIGGLKAGSFDQLGVNWLGACGRLSDYALPVEMTAAASAPLRSAE